MRFNRAEHGYSSVGCKRCCFSLPKECYGKYFSRLRSASKSSPLSLSITLLISHLPLCFLNCISTFLSSRPLLLFALQRKTISTFALLPQTTDLSTRKVVGYCWDWVKGSPSM